MTGDGGDESPLTGGGRTIVARRGNVVLRETGPWATTVHELLRHLERVGFTGAPLVVGTGFDESGRETLSWVEGEFVHPGPWGAAALPVIGHMLRNLHDATASFEIPQDASWRPWVGRAIGGGQRVIGHCDTGPWNIVARDGLPIALIDWEVAGPVDPLVELAQASWLNAQLHDDDIVERQGLSSTEARASQVRALLDGYGLARAERAGFVDLLVEFAIRDAAEQAIEAHVTSDTIDPEPLWGITWRTRSAAWMLRNRSILERALA